MKQKAYRSSNRRQNSLYCLTEDWGVERICSFLSEFLQEAYYRMISEINIGFCSIYGILAGARKSSNVRVKTISLLGAKNNHDFINNRDIVPMILNCGL